MNTLIVPCAGKSTRFPNMCPKWMLYYPDGKMMVEKAIEGLQVEEFDRIIFTIVEEHVEKYNAKKILEEIFDFQHSKKYELCILDDFTSCQAETVYQTLEKCNVVGRFGVKDTDNLISVEVKSLSEYIVGIDIANFPKEIARLSAKSFMILNNHNIVIDIIEKRIKSEYICAGMYGFESAERFKDAYNHLRKISDTRYEIYLSHIISYLIGTKKSVYQYIEAKDYEDWGTVTDWNAVLKEKQTIVLNIEGILFEKVEHYGANNWNSDFRPIELNLSRLKLLIGQGAQVILLTSMSDEHRNRIERFLKENEIDYYQLITGCFLSHEILIKCNDRTIPYPGCEAINLSKGTLLKDYI